MLKDLMTEKRNHNTENIDEMSTFQIMEIINKQDKKVPLAIKNELTNIASAVDIITNSLKNDGRLFYIGAGTSGRLGVLDASECPPTFGTDSDQIIGIIAGGDYALRNAVEDAEDDALQGEKDIENHNINERDILVGIAASGRTPYVIGAMNYAKSIGVHTIGVNCSKGSILDQEADTAITIDVGPEVITGSTRMKSGTAQKLVLNMLTTGSMIKLGKVYKNLMVDVQPTNEKLKYRQINIIKEATGVNEVQSKRALNEADQNTKLAIFMLLSDLNKEQALEILNNHNGHIKKALKALD